MITLFKNKARMARLQEVLEHSFSRVRTDTRVLYDWVRYLHQQHLSSQRTMAHRMSRQRHSLTREDIQNLVGAYGFDTFEKKVSAIEERIRKLELRLQEQHVQQIVRVERVEPERPKMTHLQEKIVRNVVQRSKDYIKKTILSLMQKYDSITATTLREMVVEEQKLCSRSSFYRILEELQREKNLDILSSGKERIFRVKQKTI